MEEHDSYEDAIDAWKRHDWTVEQARFAEAVMRHGDAARAWIESYSKEAAETEERYRHIRANIEGDKILGMEFMRSYLSFLRGKLRERLDVTKENVLDELARLAHSNFADFVVLQEDGTPQFDTSRLNRDQWAAVQEMTIDTYMDGRGDDARQVRSVKVKLAPKIGPLEALGKHMKLFTEVVEVGTLTDYAAAMNQARQARRKRQSKHEESETDGNEDD